MEERKNKKQRVLARNVYISKILYELYESLIFQRFALYELLYEHCTTLYEKGEENAMTVKKTTDAPDVVSVTRCADCLYWEPNNAEE